MSNISRRKFLKGAGVVALAVAASGVLAGCSGNGDKIPGTEIPDVPEVTSVDLRVLFVDEKGNHVGNGVTGHYDTTVLKDAKRYAPKLIPADKLPEGYELASEDEVDIINNGNMNLALVPLKLHEEESESPSKTRVKITLQFTTPGNAPRELDVVVNKLFDSGDRLVVADFKDALYEKYSDVEIWNEGWSSPLERMNGYYKASYDFPVRIKGSEI